MSNSIIEYILFSFYLMINSFYSPPLPKNTLLLAEQGKMSNILIPGVALDTLYGCLQVLSTTFIN